MSKSATKRIHPAIKSGRKDPPSLLTREERAIETVLNAANPHDAESQNLDSSNVTKLTQPGAATDASAIDWKPGVVYNIPWRDLQVESGYNVRTFNPDNVTHRRLAESIRLVGVQTPLTVRIGADGKPVIVSGHLRAGSCDWLARDGGGKKSMVPSVPVILRADLDDTRKRTGDLAISNSAVSLTPMEKAETSVKMHADGYSDSAIGAHLGCGTKWATQLRDLYEVRGTALADMVQQDKISATFARDLLVAHGAESAVSLAVAVFAELTASAHYGDIVKVTKGKVDSYLAKLAKQTTSPKPADPSGPADGAEPADGPAREPVLMDALALAQAEVAAAKAELGLAEARRAGARGNSVKKAERVVAEHVAALQAAEARVIELTPAPAAPVEPAADATKRGASKRTGANAEKDTGNGPAKPAGPVAFSRAPNSKTIAYATGYAGHGERSGKVAVTATHATLAAWVESLMNENADSMPVLD